MYWVIRAVSYFSNWFREMYSCSSAGNVQKEQYKTESGKRGSRKGADGASGDAPSAAEGVAAELAPCSADRPAPTVAGPASMVRSGELLLNCFRIKTVNTKSAASGSVV